MADQTRQIEELFQKAIALSSNDRVRFLNENCSDSAIRSEVEKLLAYDNIEGGGLTDQFDDRHMPTKGMELSAPGRGDVSLPVSPSSSSSSSSIDHGRFLPGTVLSDRYRIVGMLGKGGMGEVYRADDLELGQSVALKFLPKKLAEDPRALERFRGEVRLARQVSHPNVCRVYDIGQINGQWFLSMEYVDGEDLAQLLTRIGRFPQERATELARQLCLGLHAAHEKGVLHRDLKPANIMIDGRGKLLITDFGLAEIADDVREDDIRSGTPAYMSPEQLAGREVTERSDIYSLGIILHEIYTGKPVWKADSMAELFEKRKSGTAPDPSSRESDLDPAVESVIKRCLEPDPAKRPGSAIAVTAALPGGDPLAAALEAGITPSPEMVAASGGEGSLSLRAGSTCLAIIVLGLLIAVTLNRFRITPTLFDKLNPNSMTPVQLQYFVRHEILAKTGHFDTDNLPRHSTFGVRTVGQFGKRNSLEFWYRQQQSERLLPNYGEAIDILRPSPFQPGMTSVRVDMEGKLLELVAVADEQSSQSEPQIIPSTSQLFSLAGLKVDEFDPVDRPPEEFEDFRPPVYMDRVDWFQIPNVEKSPIVVVAKDRDRLAYFYVEHYSNLDEAGPTFTASASTEETPWLLNLLRIVIEIGSIWLGIHVLRSGRADLKGALRFVSALAVLRILTWVFVESHSLDLTRELATLDQFLFYRVYPHVVVFGFFYLGLEPFVRRYWPDVMIGWSRLLSGRLRDPLLGREILMGATSGICVLVLGMFSDILLEQLGIPNEKKLRAFGQLGNPIASTILFLYQSINVGMFQFAVLFVLRFLLRNTWLAVLGVMLMAFVLGQGQSIADAIIISVFTGIAMWTIVRFGFLAGACFMFTCLAIRPLQFVPWHPGTWYGGSTLWLIAIFVAFAGYGFFISTLSSRTRFERSTS